MSCGPRDPSGSCTVPHALIIPEALHGFAHAVVRRNDLDDDERGVYDYAIVLLKRAPHDKHIRHTIPRGMDSCATFWTDVDVKLLLKSPQIQDKDFLQGTMIWCSHVPLHDYAIEIFAIAVGIARVQILL